MRFGLVANRLHLQQAGGALGRWAAQCESGIRALNLGLEAVGGTYDALARQRLLMNHPPLVALPHGGQGALMRLVSRIAIELALAGHATDMTESAWHDVGGKTVALIAHDAHKPQMVAFAARHFDLLSKFERRVGTGTTGGLLNDMAWSRGWPADRPWVTRYLSGPLGVDAQIAELVLDRRCQKVIFFEDPHVARQHEADIQLLERAVGSATHETTCFNSPAMAERWASAMALAS